MFVWKNSFLSVLALQVPGELGFRVCKLLSVDPSNYDDAPREGIRRILEEVRLSRSWSAACACRSLPSIDVLVFLDRACRSLRG